MTEEDQPAEPAAPATAPDEAAVVPPSPPQTPEPSPPGEVAAATEQNPPVDPSPADQSPAEPRRRRRSLLVLALVAVVVVVAIVAVRLAGGDDDPTSGRDSQGGSGGGASAVPTPPASAPGQGSYVKSTVEADGGVAVQQWIRSSTQIRTLDVSLIDPVTSGSAQAVDVVVQALDGSVLAKRDSVGSDQVRLTLKTAVPNLYLSYHITGAADDASQTVAGRMLVTVLGMDVAYSGSNGGVQRMVTGPGAVSNVACLRVAAQASAAPKPCGSPTADGGWLVDLRGIDRSDRLLAQLASTS